MYTTNHRTVRVDESKGLTLLYRGIITRSDLVNVKDGKIIIEDTTFAIVKRIINYIDVEVLTETGWTLVEAGDETSLAVSFENMTVHNKQNEEVIIHEDPAIEHVVENTEINDEAPVESDHVEETVAPTKEEIIDGETEVAEDVSTEETDTVDEEEYTDNTNAEDSNSSSVEITMDADKSQQNYNNYQKNFNKKKHRR